MSTLIVAEKNKAAKAIAEAIGITKLIKNHNNSNVYFIHSKDIYVLPLRGHILTYKNTKAFESWTKSIPREIITNPNSIYIKFNT